MKWSRAGSALMVAAMVAAGSFAQTNEDLQRQLNELKSSMQSQVQRLEAENAALKAQQAPQDAGLETEINRLNERMAAGTNLRSCASQIRLGGEFRYRVAYIDGETGAFGNLVPTPIGKGPVEGNGFEGEDVSGYYGDMRTRLNFQYDFGSDVTAFAELQAHEAFGEDITGPIDELDGNDPDGDVQMYQTWLEFRNIFGGCGGSGLSARIGRQEVVLGNQFQFGNADWYNGVVHDGLRVDWKSNCWGLTLLASKLTTLDGDFNQLWSYASGHDDDELYAAYFTLRSIRALSIDAYWIYVNGHGGFAHNSGTQLFLDGGFLYPNATAYFNTWGARIGGTIGIGCGLDYSVEAAIQDGHTGDLDTDGVTVEAELGYTFSRRNHFRIFARGLWAEGGDDESAGYQTLFPNRHSNTGFRARYGIADLIPMEGVQTVQLGLQFDPTCNWTLGATGLYAQADNDFDFEEDNASLSEIDIWAEYRHSANLTLGVGLAFVLPDDFGGVDTDLLDDTQFIGYVQARLIF
jgi:hypothetical protein